MGNTTSKKQLDAATLPPENFAVSPGSIQFDYGEETLTYAGEEFHTTAPGVRAMLDKFGVAVIPNVLTAEECSQMNEGMWSTAEHLTSRLEVPLKRSDPATYGSLLQLKPKAGTSKF